MKTLTQNNTETEFKQFLNECEVVYDRYDYDNDIAYLNDVNGALIASIDFTKSEFKLDFPSFYINEDTEITPSEKQLDAIYEKIYNEAITDSNDKADVKKEKEETPYFYLTA